MKRRGFLLGLLATPAIVRAGSLEYVPRKLILPQRKLTMIEFMRLLHPMRLWQEQLVETLTAPNEYLTALPMKTATEIQLRYGSCIQYGTHT